jgi:hypothetical protein
MFLFFYTNHSHTLNRTTDGINTPNKDVMSSQDNPHKKNCGINLIKISTNSNYQNDNYKVQMSKKTTLLVFGHTLL